MNDNRGFTLVELMIVVVIIGILAAIAIPNFVGMEARAREGGTKSNMHLFQLSAEDYSIRNNAVYADDAANVATILPGGMVNPFSKLAGSGLSWEDRPSVTANPTMVPGMVSYSDSMSRWYNIKGVGANSQLLLVLTAGQ
jgi:prepilin-type N-terminal cleavage/methylation domain-containing protein